MGGGALSEEGQELGHLVDAGASFQDGEEMGGGVRSGGKKENSCLLLASPLWAALFQGRGALAQGPACHRLVGEWVRGRSDRRWPYLCAQGTDGS